MKIEIAEYPNSLIYFQKYDEYFYYIFLIYEVVNMNTKSLHFDESINC